MLGTGLVRLNLVWDGLQFGDSGYNALRTLVDGLGNLLQQTSVFAVEMTATASQAEQILEAVAKAAEAASLREANEQSRAQRSGFSEASKVVKTPMLLVVQTLVKTKHTGWTFHSLSSNGFSMRNLAMKRSQTC